MDLDFQIVIWIMISGMIRSKTNLFKILLEDINVLKSLLSFKTLI